MLLFNLLSILILLSSILFKLLLHSFNKNSFVLFLNILFLIYLLHVISLIFSYEALISKDAVSVVSKLIEFTEEFKFFSFISFFEILFDENKNLFSD